MIPSKHAQIEGTGSLTVPRGTRQDVDALQGRGVLQSHEEWSARNEELAQTISDLMRGHAISKTKRALDVGCMAGELTDKYGVDLALQWFGVDPDINCDRISPCGAILKRACGHALPFPDEHFDCVTFANVYEHISPPLRNATIREIFRVLTPGGILVGQLPNPYFPIESHSRLPFLGYLPRAVQRVYWQLTPTGWNFDSAHFFSVSIGDLRERALAEGFELRVVRDFNYSARAVPKSMRRLAIIHSYCKIIPWSWQFVFQKPSEVANAR
jgi:SAM-dependent methyltransferase